MIEKFASLDPEFWSTGITSSSSAKARTAASRARRFFRTRCAGPGAMRSNHLSRRILLLSAIRPPLTPTDPRLGPSRSATRKSNLLAGTTPVPALRQAIKSARRPPLNRNPAMGGAPRFTRLPVGLLQNGRSTLGLRFTFWVSSQTPGKARRRPLATPEPRETRRSYRIVPAKTSGHNFIAAPAAGPNVPAALARLATTRRSGRSVAAGKSAVRFPRDCTAARRRSS